MNFLVGLLSTKITSGGIWADIFNWCTDFIPSYCWVVVILTILIKLLLSPLECKQKAQSIAQMKKQQLVQGEIEKIKAKYGNNQELIAKKTEEVYKKNGVNQIEPGSMKWSLLYMVLSMVIIISLYSSVGTFSKNILTQEFNSMQSTYVQVYNYTKYQDDGENTTAEYNGYYNEFMTEFTNNYNADTMSGYATKEEYATSMADNEISKISQNAVLNGTTLESRTGGEDITLTGYKDMIEGWLWVKNVWRPDSVSSVFPSASEFISSSGISFSLKKAYVIAEPTDLDVIVEVVNGEEVRYKKGADGKKIVDYEYYYIDMNGKIYYSAEIENQGKAEEAQITESTAKENGKNAFIADYNTITSEVRKNYSGANGYYITLILMAIMIYVSNKLSSLGLKTKNKKGEEEQVKGNTMGKGMSLFLIGFIILVSINRATIFSVFMLVQYIISLPINYVINLISNKESEKKEQQHTEQIVADYVRR